MELVYLWVEKYKNIRNQGFNFSPRFEFEYIQDKNELILKKENKDYVSIFPDNINVTAIVGENGSGKSSVLQLLMNKFIDFNYEGSEQIIRFFAIYKYINPNNKKIEFIFSNDDEDYSIKINSFYFKNKPKNFLEKDKVNKIMENTVVLHYSPILSSENVDFAPRNPETTVPQTKDISYSSLLNNRNLSYYNQDKYGDYSKTNFQSVLSSFDTYQKVIYMANKYVDIDLPFEIPQTIKIENIKFFNKIKHDSEKLNKDLGNFIGSQFKSYSRYYVANAQNVVSLKISKSSKPSKIHSIFTKNLSSQNP